MKLLFIYFYETQATFEKGTIIRFSKKYNIDNLKELNQKSHFNIYLSNNVTYQDNFYSSNTDIGVIIGENGTGKSILLNAIRDDNNNYSIIIYENNGKFFFINHVHKTITIELDNRIKKVEKVNNNFEYIYYSSIIDSSENDITSTYNISNRNLLNQYDGLSLNNTLSLIENEDIHKYFILSNNMINSDILNIKKVDKVKVYYSKIYFQEVEKKLFLNYNDKLIETILYIINTNPEQNKTFIFKLFKDIPISTKKEILYSAYNNFNNLSEIFIYNKKLIDTHFDNKTMFKKNKLNEYNSIFDDFCLDIKTIEEYKILTKSLEKNFYTEDLFYEDIKYMPKISHRLEFELTSIFSSLYDFILRNFYSYVNSEAKDNNNSKCKEFLEKFNNNEINKSDEDIYLKAISIIFKSLVNEIYNEIIDNTQNKRILKSVFKSNISVLLKIFILKNNRINKLKFDDIDMKLYDLILLESIKFNSLDIRFLFDNLTTSSKNIKEFIFNNIKMIMINILELNIVKLLFILEFKKLLEVQHPDFLISRLLAVLNMTTSLCDNSDKYIDFNINKGMNSSHITEEIEHHFKLFEFGREFNSTTFDKYTISVNNQNSIFEINNSFFKFYKFLINDKIKPFTYEIEPPFSSGEKTKLILFARINDAIQKINTEKENQNIIILLDEADLKLHLEWQRTFIDDLLLFFNSYSTNKFYILYATHSPMILSDITNDRIVFLEKDKETKFSNDKQDSNKDNILSIDSTFGANIYDIYNDSFFMKSFMGNFAEKKINQVIDIINLYKITKELNNNTNKEIKEEFINSFNSFFNTDIKEANISKEVNELLQSTEFIHNIKLTIQSIGEPMLKNKMLNDIKYLFDEKQNIDDILTILKNKNNKDRLEIIDRYTPTEQSEILKKLYLKNSDD